jgi:hypothetical protein
MKHDVRTGFKSAVGAVVLLGGAFLLGWLLGNYS